MDPLVEVSEIACATVTVITIVELIDDESEAVIVSVYTPEVVDIPTIRTAVLAVCVSIVIAAGPLPVKVKRIGVLLEVAVTVSYAILPLVTNSDWVVAVKIGGAKYVYTEVAVTDPDGFVIIIFFDPVLPIGVLIAMVVAVMVSSVAATPPTVTLVVPVRFVPVITVEVPPKVEPEFTEIEL